MLISQGVHSTLLNRKVQWFVLLKFICLEIQKDPQEGY